MSTVDKNTANWRLFGGGGLLLGGILWLVTVVAGPAMGAEVTKWLTLVALVVVALGFFFTSWGQTGSNGAVGGSMFGKLGLWLAALGTLLWAIMPLFAAGDKTLTLVVAILVVAGTAIAAVVIMQKGVARGLAKWAMVVVFILALLYFLGVVVPIAALADSVMLIIFAIVVALTGLLYLLNKK